jgi:hypothetical protein
MAYRANVFATSDCQRRLTRVYAQRLEITPERLQKLAGDPAVKSGAIARQFGYGRAAFFTYLTQHQELWDVYAAARLRAGKQVGRPLLHTTWKTNDTKSGRRRWARPPVTHYFLRAEEESPHEIEKLISRGKAKGKAAA